MNQYKIGDVTQVTGLSADTLRYYEKIKILPKIHRNTSGLRVYTDKDISKLQFIQRAQKMNFSLAEIKDLLKMRENPQNARLSVRALAKQKLLEVEDRLTDLKTLYNELTLLVNLCAGSEQGCPIIETLDKKQLSSGGRNT